MPLAITVNKSDLRFELPLEIAGWLLRRFTVATGEWVLVGTHDLRARLASNLVIRSPVALNVVVGLTELSASRVCCWFA